MDNRAKKELGFSMNELNGNTVLIEGVAQGKMSKKTKMKYERNLAKIHLHLFDNEDIERLQKIEIKMVQNEKGIVEKIVISISKITKFLLK